ncbi:MAG: polyamine ABC transporter ATP-binding protein [Rhodobacteraceae bacterium]|nr:MAG: polyamine ABC transporter ATP-binding protein [Paracoccaceae bacterium]
MAEPSLAADAKPWNNSAATPFIRIKNITKKFGEFAAVDDITLDIYKGELFCLLGGSGCGKSTLLRMLAGFEAPTSGSIEIDGQDVAKIAAFDRPTNMMFQSYALFPHMSVEKNIAYGLLREGVPKGEAMDRVADMLRLVKLQDFAKRKPHQLSGGQQQRVALARSLIKQPKLLLLDEPLGALDKKLREETQFELIQIQETLGVTFIVVTHDQEEAMTLSTRIGVMKDGKIVQVGEPPQIYEDPNSKYVADFIGSVNMFEGTVDVAVPDTLRIKSPEAGIDLLVEPIAGLKANQDVSVAIRPERIAVTRHKPEGAANVVEGEVEEVAYLGNISILRVKLASGKILKVTKSNLLHDEEPIKWDEKVFLSWSNAAGIVLTT